MKGLRRTSCVHSNDLANAFNKFYHETKILSEEDAKEERLYCALEADKRRAGDLHRSAWI